MPVFIRQTPIACAFSGCLGTTHGDGCPSRKRICFHISQPRNFTTGAPVNPPQQHIRQPESTLISRQIIEKIASAENPPKEPHMNKAAFAAAALLLAACSAPTHHKPRTHTKAHPSAPMPELSEVDTLGLLLAAEQRSSGKARSILQQARRAVLDDKTVIRGSCWDYLDRVFTQAGVPRVLRKTVFQSQKNGPYAPIGQIQAGDWLYYINYGYHNVEHSGLFIGWTDAAKRQALVLSYAGNGHHETARYKIYDLSGVYQITRAP